jgi:hypothetical protein
MSLRKGGIVAAYELESCRFQLLDLANERAQSSGSLIRFATNDQTSFQSARDPVLFR